MSDLRAAAQQALEALENVRSYDKQDLYRLDEDITALRTAIEQAEKQEPVAWMYEVNGMPRVTFCDQREVEKAHPELKPSKPLFIIPPPRRWVDLTDKEIEEVFPAIATYHPANKTLYRSIARAIEAKLKELNT
jgi:hypothetical protein